MQEKLRREAKREKRRNFIVETVKSLIPELSEQISSKICGSQIPKTKNNSFKATHDRVRCDGC